MPLASTPDVQQMVLHDPIQLGGSQDRSWSLPHRSKPERSVRLMQERCSHYDGPARAGGSREGFGGLEDAFPSRQGAGGFGSLEDAFPSRQAQGGFGSVEDAFPSRQANGGGFSGGLEDAFPPRRAGGMQEGPARAPAAGSLEEAFPPRRRPASTGKPPRP
ncbi:unnamed protein product [Symbiodinium microadriaticum]|nr:unnamed protein product [Symbiodinium microadriaticum]